MESEEAVPEEVKEGGAAPSPSTPPSETGGGPDRLQVVLAACGIAGPLLYSSVVIVLGFLRPGYDHVTQFVSELGEVGAPNAIVMNTFGFILPSLLVIAFAFGLHRGISDGLWSKLAPALLAVGALGWVGSALFPCSPGCDPATSTSHFQAGAIGFGRFLAPIAFWLSLRKDSRWQGYGSYSLVTGVVVLAVYYFAGFSGVTGPWDGLVQRLWKGIVFLWMVVMAIHLLRLSLHANAGGRPAG